MRAGTLRQRTYFLRKGTALTPGEEALKLTKTGNSTLTVHVELKPSGRGTANRSLRSINATEVPRSISNSQPPLQGVSLFVPRDAGYLAGVCDGKHKPRLHAWSLTRMPAWYVLQRIYKRLRKSPMRGMVRERTTQITNRVAIRFDGRGLGEHNMDAKYSPVCRSG